MDGAPINGRREGQAVGLSAGREPLARLGVIRVMHFPRLRDGDLDFKDES